MSEAVTIYDGSGRPIPKSRFVRARFMSQAYDAASATDAALTSWNPPLQSADSAILPERDQIIARTRDLVRNDGWASSTLAKHLDNVIGAGWRLSSKPDFRALGQTPEWAMEFARTVESEWRIFAHDPLRRCDLRRQLDMNGLIGLLYRHRITDGEALALIPWRDRGGIYSTCVQVLDPDRLSNPRGTADEDFLRGGVELDKDSVAIAYHIRKTHPGDWYMGSGNFEWERVAKEYPWGRQLVIHDFDAERAGQTRGAPPLAPILKKFRLLDRYDQAELQAAILNAVLAAFVESPLDQAFLQTALETNEEATGELSAYQSGRVGFHNDSRLMLGGTRIPLLYPGEKLSMLNAVRPATAFEAFERNILRNIAASMGMTYEQATMDWSNVNYSSARAALLEVWRGFTARRSTFAANTVTPIFFAFLEEAIQRGRIELPAGAPDFYENPGAYARCKWVGPGRGWVDPMKEAQAAQLRMEIGVSTLESECAEQGGDWEEILEQRAREEAKMRELGLTRAAPSFGKPSAPAPQLPLPEEDSGDDTSTDEPDAEAEAA